MVVKLLFEKVVLGQTRLINYTTIPGANVGQVLITMGVVGNPFWCWPTIPAGKVVACDFSNAPIATNSASDNNDLIAAISEVPENVLVYDPPL